MKTKQNPTEPLSASKTIDPTKYYTCYEIVQAGYLPHVKDVRHMTRLAMTDKMTNNYLDAVRVPRGNGGVQYRILGANLITYLVNKE